MAKVVVGAEVKVDGLDKAAQSVGSFKKQLREAQADLVTMADKFGLASKEAQAAAMKVAGLKDAIGDAKALADTFNPDKKFVALGGAVQGVVAGFSAFTGAMGLLGAESKEVEGLLLKVQSAMAIQQGLSGIAGAVDSFKLLSTTIVQKVVTAFSTLRGAIISTGIGALVVGLGILVANFDKVKTALGFATKAQQAYNDTLEDYQNGAKSAIEKTNQVRTAFDNARAGVISKKEALNIYNNTLGDTIGKAKTYEEAEDNFVKKAGVYIQIMGLKAQANALFAKSAEEAAKGIVSVNQDNTSLLDKAKLGITQFFGFNKSAVKNLIEAQTEGTKTIQDNAKVNSDALYNEGLKLGTLAEQLAKDNAIKLTNVESAKNETIRQKAINHNKELLDVQKDFRIKLKDDADAAAQEFIDAEQARLDAERQRLIDNEALRLQTVAELAELALLNDPNSIDNKIAKINADLEVELQTLAAGDLRRQILTQQAANDLTDLKQDAADRDLALAQAAQRQQLDATASGLSALSDLAGRETAAGKVLAIAEATINTYKAAAQVFARPAPGTPPTSLGVKIASMVAAIATGIGTVKKIVGTKVPKGGGGGGGGNLSVPSISAAAPIVPQAQVTNLSQASINAVGNAANRNYVLETDVSSNQERIRRINRASRIN
jgi:hypothetical protein